MADLNIMVVAYLYFFVVGVCLGSFSNVLIYRIPLKQSIAKGRSHCGGCNRQIPAYDLIPIVSYVILKGRCRFCNEKIGIIHPIIELMGGLVAVFCFWFFKFDPLGLVVYAIMMVLMVIAIIDWRHMIIPDSLNAILLILFGVYLFFTYQSWQSHLLGALVVPGIMIATNLLVPSSFGGGDVKLMIASGIGLGLANSLLAGFIGVIVAGGYAFYLILTKKVNRKSHIAFGPYLCLGIVAAVFYGPKIIQSYLDLFNI
ncbi:MAG: prepilin peptidase [Erysipelotrichaceae bacterium]|nr:prepilin peptidase [Erysipelotrichaceae bacterium]